MQKFWFFIFLFSVVNNRCVFTHRDNVSIRKSIKNESTDIASEKDARLLIFATLEGNLVAIEQQTGRIRWKIKDKPIVKVPLDTKDAIIPVLLPDPRDGSLYLVGDSAEPLKKLPFTIPELVASSPCKSSDGILYTGKKKDSWFMLDPLTGQREQILGWETQRATCPVMSSDAVYLGRTQYSIMMVDTRNQHRKWNITFYDYTASPMDKDEMNNYELVHFTSSSTGRVVTMDRRRGSVLWDGDLGSPITAVYILHKDGLLSAPFTSMANHTLTHLAAHFLTHQQPFNSEPAHMKLYPTLYVGEHIHGLYALPSFVDQNVVTITPSLAGPLLLNGPNAPNPKPYPEFPVPGHNYQVHQGPSKLDLLIYQNGPEPDGHFVIFIGHYNVPEYSETRLLLNTRFDMQTKLLTDASKQNEPVGQNEINKVESPTNSVGVQTEFDGESEEIRVTFANETNMREFVTNAYSSVKLFINLQENQGLKLTLIILVGCIIAMFWYLQMQVRGFQQMSQNGSRSSQQSSVGKYGPITAVAEELPDGLMRVGKITFHPEELLGKGCEGTFVYKGEFDSRKVAVKRLLPECFTFADREVALLRESDAHPNVVRYYCTEQDRMFRYIALELCQATLSDYVQGKFDTSSIKPLDILRQAVSGLAHLHSLDIVHRDIKPHNVLISMPDKQGNVRAMISDFGLCKKLQVGRVSFSRRSGVTGTDGWIAPEMLNGNDRTTCAVDLFSLGCLFYYILSKGSHPFGETLRRQANILCGESSLNELKGPDWSVNLQKPLIMSLISSKPDDRPPCDTILCYPVFWDSKKILAFFQDVSDRVEKLEEDDFVLRALEHNSRIVVRGDWRLFIHDEVARDLRKYRTYRGDSVRDLLRALRNKKHHFRELSLDAQKSLGETPEEFKNYWLSRFPLLLVHTWLAMQIVANETAFSHYYKPPYQFALLDTHSEQMEMNVVKDLSAAALENKNYLVPVQDENPKYFSSRSPKKIRFNEKKVSRRMHERNPVSVENRQENVGLYRNLKQPEETEEMEVSDVNLKPQNQNSTKERSSKKNRGVSWRHSSKARHEKAMEKPLVWATTETKTE